MFATIVGGALALVFIGLPLAIIGLFIQSLLERRNRRPAAGDVESRPIDSEHLLGRAGLRRKHHLRIGRTRWLRVTSPDWPPRTQPAITIHERRIPQGTIAVRSGADLIPDRHSMASAPASQADRATQVNVRDRRA
jgi:hypothetical protein